MAVKISDLLPKPINVPVGGDQFLTVKSLDLKAITKVIQAHREPILQLIATAQGGKPDFAVALEMAPDMVATIIAHASGTEGQEEDIKQLPGTVQLMAMAEIWKVSVPDVKKLLDSLSGVMGQASSKPVRPAIPDAVSTTA